MKLIMIMSVAEHTHELRKLLSLHQVPVFSELDMKGVKMDSHLSDRDNWFGHTKLPAFSNLILAAVDDGKAIELMKALSAHSKQSHSTAPIHALELSVDQFA
jgi:hypothetical protein